MRFPRHFTVVAALLLSAGADVPAQAPASNTLRIFVRGVDGGTEDVTVLESPQGWTLRGSVRMRAPINVAVEYWEARYDRDWNALELTVNMTEGAVQRSVHTTFAGSVASIELVESGRTERRTANVAPNAVVLPGFVFGAYEALSARLVGAQPGSRIPALIAENAVTVTVKSVTDETIQTPGRTIAARRWTLHVAGDGKLEMDVELWTDGGRLLRIDMPGRMLSVVRDDVASVSARIVTMGRPNDEQTSIPANGFSLAATISRPAAGSTEVAPKSKVGPARMPAVVLVSGSAPTDRDEVVAGVPIFAGLANGLADQGFLVVRYDERGIGQSGGRPESATLEEFAIDARAVITFLSKRKDVDPKRIAVVGYGEGGWVALITAAAEKRVAALALIATPASAGWEHVLEQQSRMLDASGATAAERQSAVERQKALLSAVITGKGWENQTLDVRRRVDTPLYRSVLLFEPARMLARVRQPLLVVQPELDRELAQHHAEQLTQLARKRPRAAVTDVVTVPGVNHILTRAATGDVKEYDGLPDRTVSPEAIMEIAAWLRRTTLPPAVAK